MMSAVDPVQAVAEALAGHPSMETEPGYNPWTGGALLHQVCAGCGMQLAEGRKSRALEAFGHHLASVAVAAARPAIEHEARTDRDTLAARLAAVEALADGPAGDGYRPYAVIIGAETHLAVLLDDLRAALATDLP